MYSSFGIFLLEEIFPIFIPLISNFQFRKNFFSKESFLLCCWKNNSEIFFISPVSWMFNVIGPAHVYTISLLIWIFIRIPVAKYLSLVETRHCDGMTCEIVANMSWGLCKIMAMLIMRKTTTEQEVMLIMLLSSSNMNFLQFLSFFIWISQRIDVWEISPT